MKQEEKEDDGKETYKVVFTCLVKACNSHTAIGLAKEKVEEAQQEEIHCEWL